MKFALIDATNCCVVSRHHTRGGAEDSQTRLQRVAPHLQTLVVEEQVGTWLLPRSKLSPARVAMLVQQDAEAKRKTITKA